MTQYGWQSIKPVTCDTRTTLIVLVVVKMTDPARTRFTMPYCTPITVLTHEFLLWNNNENPPSIEEREEDPTRCNSLRSQSQIDRKGTTIPSSWFSILYQQEEMCWLGRIKSKQTNCLICSMLQGTPSKSLLLGGIVNNAHKFRKANSNLINTRLSHCASRLLLQECYRYKTTR